MEFPCDVRYIYIYYVYKKYICNIKIMLHENVLCKYFNYTYYNCIIIHNILYHFHIFYVKHNYVYIIIIYST